MTIANLCKKYRAISEELQFTLGVQEWQRLKFKKMARSQAETQGVQLSMASPCHLYTDGQNFIKKLHNYRRKTLCTITGNFTKKC